MYSKDDFFSIDAYMADGYGMQKSNMHDTVTSIPHLPHETCFGFQGKCHTAVSIRNPVAFSCMHAHAELPYVGTYVLDGRPSNDIASVKLTSRGQAGRNLRKRVAGGSRRSRSRSGSVRFSCVFQL